MKNLMIVVIAMFVSMSTFADMDKKECKAFKKENRMILIDMTADQAFCISKKAKLVKQYRGQTEKYKGKLVQTYMHKAWGGMGSYSIFVIVDDVVVASVKS
jgi:hypothetical protein